MRISCAYSKIYMWWSTMGLLASAVAGGQGCLRHHHYAIIKVLHLHCVEISRPAMSDKPTHSLYRGVIYITPVAVERPQINPN